MGKRLTNLKKIVFDFVQLNKTINEIKIIMKRCSKTRKRALEKSLRRLQKRKSKMARQMADLVLLKSNWRHIEASVNGGNNFVSFLYRPYKCPRNLKGHDVVDLSKGIICYRRPPYGAHGRQNVCCIPIDKPKPIKVPQTNSQLISRFEAV